MLVQGDQMEINMDSELLSERALEMVPKLKEIFNVAKKNQRGKLFAAFAAIAAHIVTQKNITELLSAVGQSKPPVELAHLFSEDGNLLDDARAALDLMARLDNTNDLSWGSFMEYYREQYV